MSTHLYSRCLYLVLIRADEDSRGKYPLTRAAVFALVREVGWSLSCEILKIGIVDGCVLLLVDIDGSLSVSEFIERLKLGASARIVGKSHSTDAADSYWIGQSCFRPVSYQDRDEAAAVIDNITASYSADNVIGRNWFYRCDVNPHEAQIPRICHHIILLTSRSRLLLPVKYRGLLDTMTAEAVQSLGFDLIACASRRNHLHCLCRLAATDSAAKAIDGLKQALLGRMHANIHFRKFEGWSEDSVVYTVAARHIYEEEYNICHQDRAHWDKNNEMSFLYQKLDIPYFTSLR